MSVIQEFWRENHRAAQWGSGTHASCPRISCADGYNVSIQASPFHYCQPRGYLFDGKYSAWELGFPSETDILLDPYAEEPESLLQTVYGYVPTEVVDALIAKHGGIAAREAKP